MIRTQVRPEVKRTSRQPVQASTGSGGSTDNLSHALGQLATMPLARRRRASKATKTKIDAVWGVPAASMCVQGARAAITRRHHMRN